MAAVCRSTVSVGHCASGRLEEMLISTKIGRLLRPPADPADFATKRGGVSWAHGLRFEHRYDYSYDGVMRSWEDSLQRLGLPRVDLLVIHDLDRALGHHGSDEAVTAHMAQLLTGGFRALAELKAAGRIRAIGCGVNDLGTIPRFAALFDLDFFLVALRYTLGEQETLADEIPLLEKRGIGMIIGGVFNSGLYAAGPVPGIRYNYLEPSGEILQKALRIDAICHRHGVPLAAAALQFPLHHPLVASVIPGAVGPAQVRANLALLRRDIPSALWAELKQERLLRADAPTP